MPSLFFSQNYFRWVPLHSWPQSCNISQLKVKDINPLFRFVYLQRTWVNMDILFDGFQYCFHQWNRWKFQSYFTGMPMDMHIGFTKYWSFQYLRDNHSSTCHYIKNGCSISSTQRSNIQSFLYKYFYQFL